MERNNGRGGTLVVPRLPDGRILLLKIHRYAPNQWSWELPGGGMEDGESAVACALRELMEETGIEGANPREIGDFSADPAFFTMSHSVVAVDLPPAAPDRVELSRSESISESRFVTEHEAWRMVESGEIFSGTVVTALALLRAAPTLPGIGDPAGQRPVRVRSRLVYDSPWWQLFEDDIVRADGSPGIYVRVRTASGGGAVLVVPRTPSGRHLLVKIARYPVGRALWEFPAGLVEQGEDPIETARRELLEETGLAASNTRLIGTQFPVAGLISDAFHTVLAEVSEVEQGDLELQADEGILEAQFATLDELSGLVRAGEIKDGNTLGAIARLLAAAHVGSTGG